MVANFWLISREVITFKTNLICISSVLKSFTWVKYSKYFIEFLFKEVSASSVLIGGGGMSLDDIVLPI